MPYGIALTAAVCGWKELWSIAPKLTRTRLPCFQYLASPLPLLAEARKPLLVPISTEDAQEATQRLVCDVCDEVFVIADGAE